MFSETGPEFSERINLEGKNTGARFSLSRGDGSESHECCCINIYINSNIQGATNSLLSDSKVEMRDPGVHLFFDGVKLGKKSKRANNKRKVQGSTSSTSYNVVPLFAFIVSILLLFSMVRII
ncbi:uncharacterized protein LOC133782053 [Humulus lupulus]|uniref:uncharacterized protein LOC133782053 n=1 Tax=Humulus lupulus TaxID=3486 RepID=UPI002B406AB0|nr:uncharacterized protein LOC133782053 [Humulus lupulus]